MSACDPVNFTFSDSAQDAYNRLASAIQGKGGTVSGNPSSGSFSITVDLVITSGTFKGTFSLSGQNGTITVTDSPWTITCGRINGLIQDHIHDIIPA